MTRQVLAALFRSWTNVSQSTKLKRSLGLPILTFYGVGTIVGGGFYALIGKAAAEAGMLVPWSFLAAAVIAAFTAFSYAELSARYPFSAGEAHYVLVAFRKLWPSAVMGWAVILTGVVSAATLADAFAGFVRTLVAIPEWILVCGMLLGLGAVAARGIGHSAVLAMIITVIEVAGLCFVMFASADALPTLVGRWRELTPTFSFPAWSGILMGAYLAFYSFVGFEDLVNVAEEVKQPSRNLPIAIFASLGITTLLYVCVTVAVVLAVDQEALIASDSPLSLVFAEGSRSRALITGVAILSGLNGALVQIVMASRVAYGLAEKKLAPAMLGVLHPMTQTPIMATFVVVGIVIALALWLPIVALAQATSTVLLIVYAFVNVALIVTKLRPSKRHTVGPVYPIILPIIGAVTCFAFVVLHTLFALGD